MTSQPEAEVPGSSWSNRGVARTQPIQRGQELRHSIQDFTPQPGEVGLWWLTQAAWLLKFPSCTIVIDPWWRDLFAGDMWAKLLGEYPLEPEDFPAPDLVLCTHWHDDHLCPESIPRMAQAFPNTRFVIPSRSVELVESWGVERSRIIPTNGHRTERVGPLTLKAVPAAHMELDFDEDGSSWYVGYVIECDGVCIYHMGDGQPWPGWHTAIGKAATDLTAHLTRKGNQSGEPSGAEGVGNNGEKGGQDGGLDVALLCINGNDNLSHIQAVDLIQKVEPKAAIPMHYGMDPDNTVDPAIYVEELARRIPQFPCTVAEVGEGLHFSKDSLKVMRE